jgi:hypothetical protein
MKAFILLVSIIFSIGVNAQKPSHDQWNDLLKKYVSDKGKVNYKGFIKDSLQLNKYLVQLSKNPPAKDWSRNEQMAYWINAYNAFTVQLITRNYPVKSIKEIGGKVPFVNSTWDIKFINIGNEKLDLNNIEHTRLRKQFGDPRIHFSLVCASVSCPKLLNEAYYPAKLDAQLDAQARDFLADPLKNKPGTDSAQLSKIFDWFKGDFTKKTDLVTFLNQYSKVKMKPSVKITYLDYNWNLNE